MYSLCSQVRFPSVRNTVSRVPGGRILARIFSQTSGLTGSSHGARLVCPGPLRRSRVTCWTMRFFGRESYASFKSRLRYLSDAGHRPWLVADHGTEHVVAATPVPFNAVHALLCGMEDRIRVLPPPTGRKAAKKLGVYEPMEPTLCGNRGAAVEAVSRSISEELARQEDNRDHVVHTVSLFGDGSGILFQRVGTDGRWLEQQCFLIDTHHSVHVYFNYDR